MNESTQMEFTVNMTCDLCVRAIEDSLKSINDVTSLKIDLKSQTVLVETSQPTAVIQEAIEASGLLAVYRAQGKTASTSAASAPMSAAISILKSETKTVGLVRFVQTAENSCIIDGSFDSLLPGKHAIHVHEFGDLRNGFESTGDVYKSTDCSNGNRVAGDLGNITADEQGRASFRYSDSVLKVWDLIGRSVCVHEKEVDLKTMEHEASGKSLACGIVARSAGLFENNKKVCSCSGKTLWEERIEARDNNEGR